MVTPRPGSASDAALLKMELGAAVERNTNIMAVETKIKVFWSRGDSIA